VAQAVECLLGKHKTLNSNPSPIPLSTPKKELGKRVFKDMRRKESQDNCRSQLVAAGPRWEDMG
jgi:hypothetical protein